MIIKIKQKVKTFFKKLFDVKRSKSFDLDAHLEYLGFYKSFENSSFCTYQNGDFYISVNKRTESIKLIQINKTLSKLNFIPESAIVLDVFVKLSLRNPKEYKL